MTIVCQRCDDTGWVCETHQELPWLGDRACECGGAGAPCPACNVPAEKDDPPRVPEGFRTAIDKDGWRH